MHVDRCWSAVTTHKCRRKGLLSFTTLTRRESRNSLQVVSLTENSYLMGCPWWNSITLTVAVGNLETKTPKLNKKEDAKLANLRHHNRQAIHHLLHPHLKKRKRYLREIARAKHAHKILTKSRWRNFQTPYLGKLPPWWNVPTASMWGQPTCRETPPQHSWLAAASSAVAASPAAASRSY